jgi:hypothetical protein
VMSEIVRVVESGLGDLEAFAAAIRMHAAT